MRFAPVVAALAMAACGGGAGSRTAVALDDQGFPVALPLPLADPFWVSATRGPRAILVGSSEPFRGVHIELARAGPAGAAARTSWSVAYYKPVTGALAFAAWEPLTLVADTTSDGEAPLSRSGDVRWRLPEAPPWEPGSLGTGAACWVSLSAPASQPSLEIRAIDVIP